MLTAVEEEEELNRGGVESEEYTLRAERLGRWMLAACRRFPFPHQHQHQQQCSPLVSWQPSPSAEAGASDVVRPDALLPMECVPLPPPPPECALTSPVTSGGGSPGSVDSPTDTGRTSNAASGGGGGAGLGVGPHRRLAREERTHRARVVTEGRASKFDRPPSERGPACGEGASWLGEALDELGHARMASVERALLARIASPFFGLPPTPHPNGELSSNNSNGHRDGLVFDAAASEDWALTLRVMLLSLQRQETKNREALQAAAVIGLASLGSRARAVCAPSAACVAPYACSQCACGAARAEGYFPRVCRCAQGKSGAVGGSFAVTATYPPCSPSLDRAKAASRALVYLP